MLTVLAAALATLAPSPPEVRAVEIPALAAFVHTAEPEGFSRAASAIAAAGMNTVILPAWEQGGPLFPSAVFNVFTGRHATQINPHDPDEFGDAAIAAHTQGLCVIARFDTIVAELLTASPADKPEEELRSAWRSHLELLHRDGGGRLADRDRRVRLNLLHPRARRLILNLVLECVETHDLDGVELDWTSFAGPREAGHDDWTRTLYAHEHGGFDAPADIGDWRDAQALATVKQFVQELRAFRPGLLISFSGTVADLKQLDAMVRWTAADAIPLGDYVRATGVSPRPDQVRVRIGGSDADMTAWGTFASSGRDLRPRDDRRLALVVSATTTLRAADREALLKRVREAGIAGIAFESTPGLSEPLPSFADPAAVPFFGPGWRPRATDLTPGEPAADGSVPWTIAPGQSDLTEGLYRIIVRRQGRWAPSGVIAVSGEAARLGTGTTFPTPIEGMFWLRDRRPDMKQPGPRTQPATP